MRLSMENGLFEPTEVIECPGAEPRMSAALLAERLGITKRQTMMRLIDRNAEGLRRFGEYLATVAKYSGRGRGQPEKDYLLNEGQAIYIASKSETALAVEVHVALVMVFMEWRRGRLSEDNAELAAKRAYYLALPEKHRTRADNSREALIQIDALISEGVGVTAAIKEVSEISGIGVRTLYAHRGKVWMVAKNDWGPAMAPRWLAQGPKGMIADCHPDAMRLFLDLALSKVRIADCYRRVIEVAEERGWTPIPCERTMRRAFDRLMPRPATRNLGGLAC